MQRIKRLAEDKFLKNNFIYFSGSMLVSFLTYLYHPILGRMMKIKDFGEAQAFFSFLAIFGVFAGVFSNIIINIVANLKSEADKKKILMLQKIGLYLSASIGLILVLFSGYFVAFFNFSSNYLFLLLALSLLLSFLASTNSAIVRGRSDFKKLSLAGIISAGSKILFSAILVYLGWAIFGAVGGMILSQLTGLVYLLIYRHKNFRLGSGFKTKIEVRTIRPELWYALLLLVFSFCVTFLTTADTIIVKKYFSPEMAGFYSGMAIISRIIIFITGSFAAVLLPAVKINDEAKENKKVLLKAFILTALIGGSALLTFTIFPGILTKILLGNRYLEFSYLLPKIGLYLFFVSLANILFIYLLALRNSFVFWAAALGPLTVLGLSFIRHQTLEMIINNFLIGSLLTFVLLLAKIYGEFFKKNKYEAVNLGSLTGLQ